MRSITTWAMFGGAALVVVAALLEWRRQRGNEPAQGLNPLLWVVMAAGFVILGCGNQIDRPWGEGLVWAGTALLLVFAGLSLRQLTRSTSRR